MPVDTDTRLPRPEELIAEALAALDESAALPPEGPTLEVEDARPLARPEYLGRHRTDGPPRELWNQNPAWFEFEQTRDLNQQQGAAVAVPLPAREPGAALAVQETPRTARLAGPQRLLASLLRALPRGSR